MDDDEFFTKFYIQPQKLNKTRRMIQDDMLDFGPEICAACPRRIECLIQEQPDSFYCKNASNRWKQTL